MTLKDCCLHDNQRTAAYLSCANLSCIWLRLHPGNQCLYPRTGSCLASSQADGTLHLIAFASRTLNPSEKNYSVIELETLAVLRAIIHFHSYLYGSCAHHLTDHSAVKATLETPNTTGKHACWCNCVYGSCAHHLTDHSAVKATLETPNPTGKHACWCNCLYGSCAHLLTNHSAVRATLETLKSHRQACLLV